MTHEPPRLPYSRVKRNRRFWEPTPEMQRLGFQAMSLGPEGPEAWTKAAQLYQAYKVAKAKAARVTTYPPGTFGSFYDHYRRSLAFGRRKTRTREDYARAWKHLEPEFARKRLKDITPDDCEAFFVRAERTLSPSERYRTVKCLRALFTAAVRRQLISSSPAETIANSQPKGRSAIWLASEVETLAATAERKGFDGLAVAIRICWDTLFSPVDVRTFTLEMVKRDMTGPYIHRARTKTSKEAFGALSEDTAARLEAYLDRRELKEGVVVRQRNGEPYRTKDTLSADFRDIRAIAFPGDKRQLMDIRRSGNVEADLAGASKEEMGQVLANQIASSKFLEETYTPPTVAKAREVAVKRAAGRARLREEVGTPASERVGTPERPMT